MQKNRLNLIKLMDFKIVLKIMCYNHRFGL